MKTLILLVILSVPFACFSQDTKTTAPKGCLMYLDEASVKEISKEAMIKWCDSTPPEIKCEDGKIYKLVNFKISFLTLKPFMNQDFGIGEGGFPVRAREAVAGANSGDTVILKEVNCTDANGNAFQIPILSFKIN
ncbi:MAG TPA: hypothetical protein VFW78_05630 [Bacteroidia bacterium]|nr:hypothetical protein [Bacteroidia bacterium]